MPELPEVETIRIGLEKFLPGMQISEVNVLRPQSIRKQLGGSEAFNQKLVGATFGQPSRRGKFLWVPIQNQTEQPTQALVVHLAMSGQLRVFGESDTGESRNQGESDGIETPHRHTRVILQGHDQDGRAQSLHFIDQRVFGHLTVVDLIPTADGLAGGKGSAAATVPTGVDHIARDLLDPALKPQTPAYQVLLKRIKQSKSGIKRILLDQRVVSGIGNIYADEALWRARVNYARAANGISLKKLDELLQAATGVMSEAVKVGGTSFDALYVNVNGESGYFSRSLHVYGRQGQPCDRCGTLIVRESFMNRGSHFCPRCQRRQGE